MADGIGRTGSGVWGNRRRPIAGDAVGHDWGTPEPLGPSRESFHGFMIFDEVDRDGHVARGRSRSCSPARASGVPTVLDALVLTMGGCARPSGRPSVR